MFDRILSLRVGDVMTREPMTVDATASMSDVSHLFTSKRLHAAPVVDEQGKCVGMITSSDFVKRNEVYSEHDNQVQQMVHDEEGMHLEPKSCEFVSDCMTSGIQAIEPGTTLIAAARIMTGAHLHVLPVIENHQPVGVLSNLDVVAALVNAFDEARNAI